MQIVIDIPDEDYNAIRDNIKAYSLADMLFGAVQCGAVLPKGHGDLIDRDTLNLDYEVSIADDWKTAHEIANCVKYASAVIHADKENKE